MNYRIIPVTAFSQNCSLIWCEQTRLAALVDPGGDAEKIKQEVDDSGLTLMQILLTHGHLDHVGAAAELGVLAARLACAKSYVWSGRVPAADARSLAERRRYHQHRECDFTGVTLPWAYAGSCRVF
ncbi:hypothetical protein ACN68_27335 [Escherichia coli]|nr:hypothetical protein ACN68_27335 [Escherichia coli]